MRRDIISSMHMYAICLLPAQLFSILMLVMLYIAYDAFSLAYDASYNIYI
jgi:hypothetical protein